MELYGKLGLKILRLRSPPSLIHPTTTVTGSNRNELGKDPTTLGFAHLNVMQPTHTTYTAG